MSVINILVSRKISILLFIILSLIAVKSEGNIILNDGQYHIIDYYEPIPINVKLDTVLEVVQGGKCNVRVGDVGKIILNGGILTTLGATDDSSVTFLNGVLNYYYGGTGDSHLEMTGGTINENYTSKAMWLHDYSTATISGGMLSGDLKIWNSSSLTLIGSDFAIDGVSVDLYEDIRDYATYEHINDGTYGYTGVITGTLADGSSLDSYFEIMDDDGESLANMYLVPEPCTILLFGVGVIGVLRRKI